MKLVSVEVDVEAHVSAGLQDAAGAVQVEDSLLTEHVDVVDAQGAGSHPVLQPGQLDLQDVLRGFSSRLPSEEHRGLSESVSGGEVQVLLCILGHCVCSAVGRGDVDGQSPPGLLDHLQHLQLALQLQAVAALTLHQGGTSSLHPGQPASQGGQQVRGARSSSVIHREVDPSTGPVHIHVGGPRQLQSRGWCVRR